MKVLFEPLYGSHQTRWLNESRLMKVGPGRLGYIGAEMLPTYNRDHNKAI